MIPVGVLASGRGSNLQALIEAFSGQDSPARIAVVVSDRPRAIALERARDAGIPTEVVLKRDHPDREAHDAAVVARLRAHGVQWVAMAGYMRLVTPILLRAFPQRILNIHPSLLPAFPGLHPQRQALECGVRIAGCTVHLVDEGTDSGPVIGQAAVPVVDGDTEDSLSARILAVEHRLYPRCLRWAVEGRLRVEGRRVKVNVSSGPDTWLLESAC